MFLIENGAIWPTSSASIHMEKGTGPKNPDQKYFQNLMKNYTEGSNTTLRTSKAATIAGKPGIDGISDAGNSAHQVQIMAAGDRVYMVIYVGPKGQENSADATRFAALQADQVMPGRTCRAAPRLARMARRMPRVRSRQLNLPGERPC